MDLNKMLNLTGIHFFQHLHAKIKLLEIIKV